MRPSLATSSSPISCLRSEADTGASQRRPAIATARSGSGVCWRSVTRSSAFTAGLPSGLVGFGLGGRGLGGLGLGGLGLLVVAALEALDAPTGVDQLLLARVERVALRAQLDVQIRLGAARRERVAAGAVHGRFFVLRVDVFLHGNGSLLGANPDHSRTAHTGRAGMIARNAVSAAIVPGFKRGPASRAGPALSASSSAAR